MLQTIGVLFFGVGISFTAAIFYRLIKWEEYPYLGTSGNSDAIGLLASLVAFALFSLFLSVAFLVIIPELAGV